MRVVMLCAGKGGVGKTRISLNIAKRLSWRTRVGVCDADFDGPDVLQQLGAEGMKLGPPAPNHQMVPLVIEGMRVISTSAMVKRSDIGAAWGGEKKAQMLHEFIGNVEWGDTDFLVVDCPAGISEQMMALANTYEVVGAVIVSTPDPVAQLDAKKVVRLFQAREVPIVGVLENMAFRKCPHCGYDDFMFGNDDVAGNVAAAYGVPFLGKVPWQDRSKGLTIESSVLDRLAERLLAEQ